MNRMPRRTFKPNSQGHVAATEVIEAKGWQSVTNVKIVGVGRFCVTPASQSAVAYRVLRNAIGMKTPRRGEGLQIRKSWETTAWPRPFAPKPVPLTLNNAEGVLPKTGYPTLGNPAEPAKSTLNGRCNGLFDWMSVSLRPGNDLTQKYPVRWLEPGVAARR
jgi:hypothetical protein